MMKSIRQIISLWALFRRAFGPYKYQIAGLAALSFTSGILEGVGINSVVPLFAFVNKGTEKGRDVISQSIEKFFHLLHLPFTLKYLLIFIALMFCAKALALFFVNYISAHVTSTYEKTTREKLFKYTLEANWPYLSEQKIGHLEQVLITDVSNSATLLSYLSGLILILSNLAMYILLAMNISFIIAAITLFLGGAVFLVFKPLFFKNKVASEKIGFLFKQLAHYVNESMLGIKTIKAMATEKEAIKKGFSYFDQLKNLNIRVLLYRNVTSLLMQPIGLLLILGLFAFFYKTTAFNFASFAVIVYAINKVFTHIQLGQTQLHGISSLSPYLTSVTTYREKARAAADNDNGKLAFYFEDRLEFKNVNFYYQSAVPIIKDLSFTIRKGEMIGLIGPSGAGKTTLVDLFLRLLEPQSGAILLDGKNISELAIHDWRRNIGYVSQEIFLLNDTIENNLKFYDDSVTLEDIRQATKMAYVDEYIKRQPQGYATVVGERGLALSAGQRQRIILARVLARKPKILVLDEATSALDNESEVFIQKAIEALRGKITVIAIAHRLSTVMSSDRLIVLDEGRIVEEGPPARLLEDHNSYFHKLFNLQKRSQ